MVLSEHELNARFAMLQQQRDNAMNVVVLQAGEIAMLRQEIANLTQPQQELPLNDNPVEVPTAQSLP